LPSATWPSLLFMEGLFLLRRVVNNPAVPRTMINHKATLCHHLFNITITESISAVPTNTLMDNGFRCVATFEGDHGLHGFAGFINIILPYDDLGSLDAIEPNSRFQNTFCHRPMNPTTRAPLRFLVAAIRLHLRMIRIS